MHLNIKQIIVKIIVFLLCISILIAAPILVTSKMKDKKIVEADQMVMLTIWQIDSFEGGKGSRVNYLKTVGNQCFKDGNTYLNVVSLTASAARQNIYNGAIPDLISYGAGVYGIENIIQGDLYYTWAHGGYCILTIDENADFSDVNSKNTVINAGLDNFSGVAALLCGLGDATVEKPTGAYVSLLNGDYKYLLGTQRDIFRLKTREAAFKVMPVTEFNDLYQNISISTKDAKKAVIAKQFIEYLLNQGENIIQLGLLGNGKYYTDEMSVMEDCNYQYKIQSPISERMYEELINAIGNSNINLLKNLLK